MITFEGYIIDKKESNIQEVYNKYVVIFIFIYEWQFV